MGTYTLKSLRAKIRSSGISRPGQIYAFSFNSRSKCLLRCKNPMCLVGVSFTPSKAAMMHKIDMLSAKVLDEINSF